MTIIFVGNGPWGTGVGRPLTIEEHDNNVYDHDGRIEALEEAEAGITIEASYTGGSITFLINGGEGEPGGYNLGPFALPTATINPVGAWANSTEYNYLDLVDVAGLGQYLVLQAHTTAAAPAEFDPTEENTEGPIYKLFSSFDSRMRWRGMFSATNYLTDDVFLDDTYGLFIVLQDHDSEEPLDPFAENTEGALYRRLAGPPYAPKDEISDTTYELSLADIGKYFHCTNAAGCEITFPDLDWPDNVEIHFRQVGADPVTFVEGATAVVLNPQREGYSTDTPWVGAVITAKYIGNGEWDLNGPHGDELTA